ncbi:MAG TPA: hypothetical protein VI732_07455 [Alphaproteobacteria bacterium]|jgi:hypothetical protein|nr:hypothetical protein [Alphaproteobacteria bacterium]
MADQNAVPTKWVLIGAFLAGLAFAIGPAASHAAGSKTGNPAKSDTAKEMAQAQDPDQSGADADLDEKKAADEADEHFQATIDVINENVGQAYGGPPFPKLEFPQPRVVKVIPNKAWMKDRRMHYRNAMMLYRMWRNANQFRPVTIMITDDGGGDYITIKDTPKGLEYRAKQE